MLKKAERPTNTDGPKAPLNLRGLEMAAVGGELGPAQSKKQAVPA